MAQYYALLTNLGATREVAAKAAGTPIVYTHMAVGDGAAASPDPARTSLVSEKFRAALNRLTINPAKPDQLIAELVIPADVGGFWIREVGLFNAAGELVAIGKVPDTYKPLSSEGAVRKQIVRMLVKVQATELVQFTLSQGEFASLSLQLTGDATGSVTFDAAGNAVMTTTVVDNSHNHTIANVTGLQAALDGKLPAAGTAVAAAKWATARTLTLTGDVTGSVAIDGSGNVNLLATVADDSHGHQIGNVVGLQTALDGKLASTGTAVAAAKWATARTLTLSGDVSGSVSFDGTGNVSMTATVADDSHGHQIGNVVGLQTALDGKLASTGTAVAAAKWASARTLTLSGDVSGAVSFDGSGNVNLLATVADDSHSHIIGNVDGLQAALDGKVSRASPVFDSGYVTINPYNSTATYDDGSVARVYYHGVNRTLLWGALDSVGATARVKHINCDMGGNADTATKLAAARTISLTGDVTGSVSFDGSGNVSLAAAVANNSHSHTIANITGLQAALDAKADLADFVNSKAGNGYQKLSNGLILQWVTVSNSAAVAGTFYTFNFPIAFPNAALFIGSCNATSSTANTAAAGSNGVSASQFQANWSSGGDRAARVFAIGY